MACRFCNKATGICDFFDDGIERPYNEDGICMCEDDEEPSNSCEDYQEL